MKAIIIQKTKGKKGFVASIIGFQGVTGFGGDEITALKSLTEKLYAKNPRFIQRSDWETPLKDNHETV